MIIYMQQRPSFLFCFVFFLLADCLTFKVDSIILNSTNTTGCTTVLMRDVDACDSKTNITVLAIFEGKMENNVTFLQQVITITTAECKHFVA